MYPIGVVAERTGLTTDVLRVWERRYGVVTPARDDAGRRLYSDADVERLRLLARATAGGRSIGQVMALEPDELEVLVHDDEAARRWTSVPERSGKAAEDFVERALAFTSALDEAGLEAELVRAAVVLGAAHFPEAVAAPFFHAVGDAWHRGEISVAQEHLATATAKAVLARLRTVLPVPRGAPVLVLATPAGERHELGALLAAAIAASEGWRVLYLGPDLPAKEITRTALQANADAVGLSVVHVPDSGGTLAEIEAVRDDLPRDIPLFLGGAGAGGLTPDPSRPGIHIVPDLAELRTALAALRGAA